MMNVQRLTADIIENKLFEIHPRGRTMKPGVDQVEYSPVPDLYRDGIVKILSGVPVDTYKLKSKMTWATCEPGEYYDYKEDDETEDPYAMELDAADDWMLDG